MKKFVSAILLLVLCCAMAVCLTACPDKTDNDEVNSADKIDLSEKFWGSYFTVNITIDPGTFKLDTDGGIYGVSGKGSATIDIIPKKPIKCYDVRFKFENLSPANLYGLGIDVTLGEVKDVAVSADGTASAVTADITYKLTNYDDLKKQIVMWHTTESDIKNSIKSIQTEVMWSGYTLAQGHILAVEKVTGEIKLEE